MKKYLLLMLLFGNIGYLQAKIVNCSANKPLRNLDGECYSCDEDQIIMTDTPNACPNRETYNYTENKYMQMAYSIKSCPREKIRNSQGICSECSKVRQVSDAEYLSFVMAFMRAKNEFKKNGSNTSIKNLLKNPLLDQSYVLESAYKTYCTPSKIVQERIALNDYPCAKEKGKPLLGIDGKCHACDEDNVKVPATDILSDLLLAKMICPDQIFYANGQKCSFEKPILTEEGCQTCQYFKSTELDIPYCPNTKDLISPSEKLAKQTFGVKDEASEEEYLSKPAHTLTVHYRALNNGKDAPECYNLCVGSRESKISEGMVLSEPICRGKGMVEYIDNDGLKFCYPCQINTGIILNESLTEEKIKRLCPNREIITYEFPMVTETEYISVLPCRDGRYDHNGVCHEDSVWSEYY